MCGSTAWGMLMVLKADMVLFAGCDPYLSAKQINVTFPFTFTTIINIYTVVNKPHDNISGKAQCMLFTYLLKLSLKDKNTNDKQYVSIPICNLN